jgi:hypothetical protein
MRNPAKPTSAIRLTRTPAVERALKVARHRYPTLNDPEIFKLALGRLADARDDADGSDAILLATRSLDADGYLSDPSEDIYQLRKGKKVPR